jgi:hypothetical protein
MYDRLKYEHTQRRSIGGSSERYRDVLIDEEWHGEDRMKYDESLIAV